MACLIFRANAPKAKVTMYSDYAAMLEDEGYQRDQRSGAEIRDDVKQMLLRRRKKRKTMAAQKESGE